MTDYDIAGINGRFLGISDPPLNEKGIKEAELLREYLEDLPIDNVYTSRSQRCQQTADIIIGHRNLTKTVDHLMNEVDYGDWEGLTKGEIIQQFPVEWKNFENNPISNVPPLGESAQACTERAIEWINKVQCQLGLAIVEKTWLRLLICKIVGIPLERYRDALDIKIASITCLLYTNRGWRIESLNLVATKRRIFGINI